jgi:type IX secretion system PorP/SprF family membrane protein
MRKLFYISLLLIMTNTIWAQHSTLTSNYLFNLFAVNPAYAGQRKALDVSVFYRKQWAGLAGAPQTTCLMGSLEIKPKNLSLGFIYENDRIGLTSINNLKIALSYRIKIDRKKTIAFGVMPAYQRIYYDWSKLRTTTQGDETFILTSPVINKFNTAAGVFYYTKKMYVGLSSPELLNFNNGNWYVEFNLVGGYVHKVNDNITLKPSILVRQIKNSPVQVDINLTTYINEILGIGLAYRNKDAVVAYFDCVLDRRFKIGYAYDLSVGKLRKYNSGTHEVMLNYYFGKLSNAPTPRFF